LWFQYLTFTVTLVQADAVSQLVNEAGKSTAPSELNKKQGPMNPQGMKVSSLADTTTF
jgi:hypothetical protein